MVSEDSVGSSTLETSEAQNPPGVSWASVGLPRRSQGGLTRAQWRLSEAQDWVMFGSAAEGWGTPMRWSGAVHTADH